MLSTEHKQHIVKHFVIGPVVINALINGVIAYALFSGQEHIALWGNPSLAVDIIATVFLLTLITSLLVGWGTNLALSHARVEAIELAGWWAGLVARLPQSAWPQALLFSVVASCCIAPVVLYVFHLLAIQSLAPLSAMLFKTLFAVALGLLLTPLIGVLALSKKPAL